MADKGRVPLPTGNPTFLHCSGKSAQHLVTKHVKNKKPALFYGWIIVAVSFVSLVLLWGARSSFSVFYVAMLEDFGQGRASTALIFSLFIFIYGLAASLAGWLVDRFGPTRTIPAGATLLAIGAFASSQATAVWQIYFFWGIMAALGLSVASFVPHTAMVSRWFIRRRGTAVGIIASGTGLGFGVAIVLQQLIEVIGWRLAYVALGGTILIVVVPLAALFQKSKPEDMGLAPDGDSRQAADSASVKSSGASIVVVDEKWASVAWTLPKAMRTRRFWALFTCFFCFNGLTIQALVAHQVAFAVDAGYSKVFASSIFGLFGIVMTAGLACGFISDMIGRERSYTLACALTVVGILFLFAVSDNSRPWLLYLFAITAGLGSGLMVPAITGAVADLFQGRNFGSIFGSATFGLGLGGGLSPWLAGYLFDLYGTYDPAFAVAVVGLCVACGSVWIASPRKVLTRRKTQPMA